MMKIVLALCVVLIIVSVSFNTFPAQERLRKVMIKKHHFSDLGKIYGPDQYKVVSYSKNEGQSTIIITLIIHDQLNCKVNVTCSHPTQAVVDNIALVILDVKEALRPRPEELLQYSPTPPPQVFSQGSSQI
jgi:hypothetical protein